MVHKSVLWEYFSLSNPTFYKNNFNLQITWCIGCLDFNMMRAREQDLSSARYHAHTALGSEAEPQNSVRNPTILSLTLTVKFC